MPPAVSPFTRSSRAWAWARRGWAWVGEDRARIAPWRGQRRADGVSSRAHVHRRPAHAEVTDGSPRPGGIRRRASLGDPRRGRRPGGLPHAAPRARLPGRARGLLPPRGARRDGRDRRGDHGRQARPRPGLGERSPGRPRGALRRRVRALRAEAPRPRRDAFGAREPPLAREPDDRDRALRQPGGAPAPRSGGGGAPRVGPRRAGRDVRLPLRLRRAPLRRRGGGAPDRRLPARPRRPEPRVHGRSARGHGRARGRPPRHEPARQPRSRRLASGHQRRRWHISTSRPTATTSPCAAATPTCPTAMR